MSNMSDEEKTIVDDAPETKEHDSQKDPKAEPSSRVDGGLTAWFQVFGGFCVFMNTWGLPNSFGVFQTYYREFFGPSISASQISWIGTIQACLILFGSLYAGPLYDRGYLRALMLGGSFMIVFGTFMNSLCDQWWQVLLSQGLFTGLGLSCLFIPMPIVVSSHFDKKRASAIAIAALGSSLAGVIYPIIFAQLIGRIGFGWTVRVLAFIFLAVQVPTIFLKPRIKSSGVRKIFAAHPWKERSYSLWSFAYFFSFLGLYIPYFYIQSQSQATGLVTGQLNFYLLAIMNGAGAPGRMWSGILGDKIGPMNAYGIQCVVCALLQYCELAINSEGGVIAFCVFYGFFSGAVVGLFPSVVVVSLTPSPEEYAARWTMMTIPPALGLLIGSPLAGAVLARGGYSALQIMGGSSMVISVLFAIASRTAKVGWTFKGYC